MPKPELREKLQRALDHAGNTHTLEDVADALEAGKAQLWVSESGESVAVTEVIKYPQKTATRIWLAAGYLEEVVEISERVVDWAKSKGHDFVVILGRRGWERAGKRMNLDQRGWAAGPSTFKREL